MQYCPFCGASVNPNADACLQCGRMMEKQGSTPTDDGNVIWLLMGLLLPTAGLALWLLWRDSVPKNAKKAGIGALIGFIARFVVCTVFNFIYAFFAFLPYFT